MHALRERDLGWLVGLAALVIGVGGLALVVPPLLAPRGTPPPDDLGIYVARHRDNRFEAQMQAIVNGTFEVQDGCLVMTTLDGIGLPVLPPEAGLARRAVGLVLVDSTSGREVARLGEEVNFSGGYIPVLAEPPLQPIPVTCRLDLFLYVNGPFEQIPGR